MITWITFIISRLARLVIRFLQQILVNSNQLSIRNPRSSPLAPAWRWCFLSLKRKWLQCLENDISCQARSICHVKLKLRICCHWGSWWGHTQMIYFRIQLYKCPTPFSWKSPLTWVFPKIRDTPKWMVYNNGKPYFSMDDLGGFNPLFSETSTLNKIPWEFFNVS